MGVEFHGIPMYKALYYMTPVIKATCAIFRHLIVFGWFSLLLAYVCLDVGRVVSKIEKCQSQDCSFGTCDDFIAFLSTWTPTQHEKLWQWNQNAKITNIRLEYSG